MKIKVLRLQEWRIDFLNRHETTCKTAPHVRLIQIKGFGGFMKDVRDTVRICTRSRRPFHLRYKGQFSPCTRTDNVLFKLLSIKSRAKWIALASVEGPHTHPNRHYSQTFSERRLQIGPVGTTHHNFSASIRHISKTLKSHAVPKFLTTTIFRSDGHRKDF
jgi:hypothetical protein